VRSESLFGSASPDFGYIHPDGMRLQRNPVQDAAGGSAAVVAGGAGRRWRVKARSAPRHSKIAAGAGEMVEMRRFARPGNPDRGTVVHPPGPLPSIREPRSPGERGAQHPGATPTRRARRPASGKAAAPSRPVSPRQSPTSPAPNRTAVAVSPRQSPTSPAPNRTAVAVSPRQSPTSPAGRPRPVGSLRRARSCSPRGNTGSARTERFGCTEVPISGSRSNGARRPPAVTRVPTVAAAGAVAMTSP